MTAPVPGSAVAVPAPARGELEQRVRAARLPISVGRVVSSVVSGFATLVLGAATVTLAVAAPLSAGLFVGLAIFGGMTAAFGFLTWRWARSLPPGKSLATEREREELEG